MIYTLKKTDDGSWLAVNILTEFPAGEGERILIRMDWREASQAARRLNAPASGGRCA